MQRREGWPSRPWALLGRGCVGSIALGLSMRRKAPGRSPNLPDLEQ